MALVRCNQCGNMVSENAQSCPKCGNPVYSHVQPPQNFNAYNNAPTSPKNKTTTALFALFLGGFGAHYFYIGKATAGIVFLVVNLIGFALFALPSIVIWVISIIQAIMMFSMTQEQFNAKYVYTQSQFPVF